MAGTALTGEAALAVEEQRLARDAAAGDARALVALYERYEARAYNLAYRITGSEADAADATEEAFLRTVRKLGSPRDGEPPFALGLFTATCRACHDLIERRQPAQPDQTSPDTPQKEIRDASMRLPERQREALALRELEGLSYEDVATSLELTPSSVAKLISRARINLSDDLHGTMLATIAAPSPECERALPLIAAREDDQLGAGSDDDAWLEAHLAGCERCRLAVEAMREAGASYRAWTPIAVLPWLFEETMAKATALADVDWGEEVAKPADSRRDPRPARRATIAAGLLALLGGGIAAVLIAGEPSPAPDQPVADTHPANHGPKRQKQRLPAGARTAETASGAQAPTASAPAPPSEAGEAAASEPPPATGHREASAVQPQHATGAAKPKPAAKPPSQPATTAATTEVQPPPPPPAEEAAPQHPSKGRGPPEGVPPGRP